MNLTTKLSAFTLCVAATFLVGCESQNQVVAPAKNLVPDENGSVVFDPGDRFSWTANTKLIAHNECTLIIPESLLEADEPISTIVDGEDNMGFFAKDGSVCFRMRPDMWIKTKAPCDATVQCPSSQPVTFTVELDEGNAG